MNPLRILPLPANATTVAASIAAALIALAPPVQARNVRLMESVADTVIFPVQDVLGLDNRSRMNVPGTVGQNWKWQLRAGQLNGDSSTRLKKLSRTYSRNQS